jgi:HD superfamily phosphohydrolase
MLEIHDDVYGPASLPPGLLSDLLDTAAVQRLRRVSQAGASSLIRAGRSVTRYEHSVGVMILTGLLGGNETEQAAGLLQDLSHTAFSHTIDYVFDDRREEFHERIFQDVVERSDVPPVLARHGLTWRDLFRPENVRRVDVPAPLLCADRIDYTLRDLTRFGRISAVEAREFVADLEFVDGRIVVNRLEAAITFAEWYRYLVGELFMNPLELYAHSVFAEILRNALHRDVIEEADLLGTDEMIISKLESDKEFGSAADLAELRGVEYVATGDTVGGRRVHSKGRIIDPPVRHAGSIAPLSTFKPDIRDSWKRIEQIASAGILVGPAIGESDGRAAGAPAGLR